MKNIWLVIFIISVIGNLAGGYILYKAWRLRTEVGQLQRYHRDLSARFQQLQDDYPGASVYTEANHRLLREAGPEQRQEMTVLFGASITKRWDLDKHFTDPRLINRGVGAQSTTQLLSRFSSDVLQLSPGQVVLKFCSGNFGPTSDYEMMFDEFETMATIASDRGIRPLLATIIPVTAGAETYDGFSITDQIRQFNTQVRELAADKNYPVVDYFEALADPDGYLPDSMARDAIHPNEIGYAIMTTTLQTHLK